MSASAAGTLHRVADDLPGEAWLTEAVADGLERFGTLLGKWAEFMRRYGQDG